MSRAYIDVRGPHPVYIKGLSGTLLEGCTRTITVEEAEALIEQDRLVKR
jgi:hypothetical protein